MAGRGAKNHLVVKQWIRWEKAFVPKGSRLEGTAKTQTSSQMQDVNTPGTSTQTVSLEEETATTVNVSTV